MKKYMILMVAAITMTTVIVAQPKNTPPPIAPGLAANGDLKRQNGNFNGALADYNTEIAKIDAEAKRIVKLKADYVKMSEFEKMNQNQDEIKRSYIDWARLYYGRAMANIGLGKKADAPADLTMAIALDERMADAYYQRALLNAGPQNRDAACTDIAKAMSLGHEKAKVAYDDNFCWNQALVYFKEGNSNLTLRKYDDAIASYDKAISLSPDSGRYYAKRGQAYYAKGDKTKALEDFTKATEVSPNQGEGFYQLGMYYFNLDEFDKAFDYFTKCLAVDKLNYNAYIYRAQCCEREQKFTSAIYDYGQAISIRPNDPEAYYRRALLNRDMKNMTDACKDFRKAASMEHPDAAGYLEECK